MDQNQESKNGEKKRSRCSFHIFPGRKHKGSLIRIYFFPRNPYNRKGMDRSFISYKTEGKTLRMKRICLLLLGLALLGGQIACAEENTETAYETYLSGGEAPKLSARYEGIFALGAEAFPYTLGDERGARLLPDHFQFITCENQMTAQELMDKSSTRRAKDKSRVKLKFDKAGKSLKFAMEQGLPVHAGALVWPSNTPLWFFTEGWTDKKGCQTVDRDTMLKRMEDYIQDAMEQVNTRYPGAVSAWYVVRDEENSSEDDLWLSVIGDDYAFLAFSFARKYAQPGQKLLYQTANWKDEEEIHRLKARLSRLMERGILDGLGLQINGSADSMNLSQLESALCAFAELEIPIHVTGLEIQNPDKTALGQMKLAIGYREVFSLLERLKTEGKTNIESVSLSGLSDGDEMDGKNKDERYSLLFDRDFQLKPAFFGALQDRAIPLSADETAVQNAVIHLGLDAIYPEEETIVNVYKTLDQHNPVMVQRFGADPWAMVYDGRVYLYMTGDEPMLDAAGGIRTNNYSNITTLRVISSADLVNWQDHGSVKAAGANGAAKWAGNSWAPCAAWKTIDGKDRFFLYFANSGGGIGVLTADSPIGPFSDPLGHALVSRQTPSCASVTWLFDPAVLVDGDGSAYLYFGGGVPEGRAADPGTARAVKLGEDMISLDGDPVTISPPWLFEDSGINKMGDTYVYSYCSNFSVPSSGSEFGFMSGEIVYMTAEAPLGPFRFAGRVLKNPSAYFGVGGNNHHCMFEFNGKYYITYHAAAVDQAMGWNAGYRSTFVDELILNEEGLPALSRGTREGVSQLCPFDPFRPVSGGTLCSLAGAETALVHPEDRRFGTGDMLVKSTAPGGWAGIAGVDFGKEGAKSVQFLYTADEGAKIEILLDDLQGEAVAFLELPASSEANSQVFSLPQEITGTHDLYFRFLQKDTALLEWQFLGK